MKKETKNYIIQN